MRDRHRTDDARSLALAAAAAAMVGTPTLGPLLAGTSEGAERYDTAVTPPGYAFGIWGPIFAGCAATAAQHAWPGRSHSIENRAVGWPLAGAYALNAAWSVAAQADRFQYTPVLLPAAVVLSATAHRRLQTSPPSRARVDGIASASTGLLLGWTSLAATVNLWAATRLRGADPTSSVSVAAATAGVLGAAAAVCVLVSRSRRGRLPLAGAAAWGLATTALDPKRPTTARFGTAVAAAAVLTTTAVTRLRRRGR